MAPVSDDNSLDRRKNDFLQGQILAILQRMETRQEKIDEDLRAILDGRRMLPQCREQVKRIEDFDKKLSQHSFGGIDQRVNVVEKWMGEQKEWNVWAIRSAVGAVIASIAYALRDRFFH